MEDKTGSFKPPRQGRFNAIDLLLILLVLCVIVGAVLIFDPFGWDAFGRQTPVGSLTYSVCIAEVEGVFLNHLAVGDAVYDAATGAPLGTVIHIQTDIPHTVLCYDETKGGYLQALPDLYDIVIDIRTEVSIKERMGYFAGEKRIAVGAQYSLVFPRFAGKGYCVAMEEAYE